MNEESTAQTYKYIRNKILKGEYLPGRPLRAELLSKEIGVSRTPVRDALRLLEVDGLVTIRPRQGAIVRYMSLEEYKDLCGFRQALETYAASLAAINRTDSELEEIHHAVLAMKDFSKRPDEWFRNEDVSNKTVKEDIRFHLGVMSASHNALIKGEIVRLHMIDRVVSGPSVMYVTGSLTSEAMLDEQRKNIVRTAKEHTEVYAAIEARNSEAAAAAMKSHIQDVIDHTIQRKGEKETSQVSSDLGY